MQWNIPYVDCESRRSMKRKVTNKSDSKDLREKNQNFFEQTEW